jgi:hypothetical protein
VSLRLPSPPPFYSQSDQSTTRAELEREDALNAKNNGDATFNDTVVNNLTVNGTQLVQNGMNVHGAVEFFSNVQVDGNFSFVALTPSPTFTVGGVTCNRLSLIFALSSQAQGQALMTPANATGFPVMRSILMSDLPDYVQLGVPDATVTTVANDVTVNKPLGLLLNIAANSVAIGDCFRMTCRGVYGDTTVAPNLTLAVLSAVGVICTTGANAVGAVSLTNRGWEVVVDFVVTALGNIAGRIEAQGRARLSTSAVAAQDIDMENTATQVFNTTIAQTLQLCVTWGTANAANTISCRETIWEILKA